MNEPKQVTPPKTADQALSRMTTIIAGEAVGLGEHPPHEVTRQTRFDHWMFRVCRDRAVLEKWPLKRDHFQWTQGNTVGDFLNQCAFEA